MSARALPPSDDLDRIMAIMDVAFPPEFGEAWTRRQIEDALLLGACHYRLIGSAGEPPSHGEAAAGFALLRTTLDEEELLLFAVRPEHRRRGLGTRLLGRIMTDAKARGCSRMLLEMRRGNPAETLYRAAGFAVMGIRPNYYRNLAGKRIDAITFSCPLLP